MNLDKTFIIIALGMIITGSINTISTKFADITYSKGIDGEVEQFDHPFFQAAGMFVGEFLCMIAFRIGILYNHCKNRPMENSKFNPLIFILPAACDMTATSLMYIGLKYTYASVFQMLRGSVVIFTGILSVFFLKKRLHLYHWLGMLLVLVGLASVGISSVLLGSGGSNAPHPLLGDIIIVSAQVVVSIQMVVEEKFISKYNVPPLQVVGWEGLWGFLMLSTLLIPFYYIPTGGGGRLENTPDAFVQIGNSWVILVATIGNIISIAFFNFFGISMTKYSSATTRMVLDSVRTVVIWGFSLLIHWQQFQYLQIIGFVLLLTGTAIYNEIIIIPISLFEPPPKPKDIPIDSEREHLINSESLQEP